MTQQSITVAIDFGTSSCAVSYSESPNEENDVVVAEWEDGFDHKKVPSAILFWKGKFFKFGNEALETYKNILLKKKNLYDYCFFEDFKMALYSDPEGQRVSIILYIMTGPMLL